jgi:hypothetical protein
MLPLVLALALAADPPPVVPDVDGQPVAANAERLARALRVLGALLPADAAEAVRAAADAHDAAAVQKALDARVLAVVTINPEARVKVARGPAAATAQQAGYTPVLVKVVNEASVKKRLNLSSPQGGPVYGGEYRWDERTPKTPASPKRFAQVELFTGPPMTAELSGVKVEYAVALVYSSEAGKREISLVFDVGEGTQDLGFRAELPVVFDVKPAVPVRLRVTDADGKPTAARFTFTDAAGHVFPPQAKRLAPDFFFQQQIYRPDGGTVLLPPGEFTMLAGRGPEYELVAYKVQVPATGPAEVAVKLVRWIDPAARGYHGGDHHIHAAGCAHYTSPTEGVMPDDMFLHVKGEGLSVGCCLTWGPCYDFQRRFFAPKAWERSEPFTVLKYDVEVSGFGSQALGHVCLLDLRDQTYPGSDGTKTKGWPTWTTPLMRWAKAQGGVTGYAHSANGLEVRPEAATRRLFTRLDRGTKGFLTADDAKDGPWPLPEPFAKADADGDGKITEVELCQSADRTRTALPNLNIPEMNGIGAQEICVTTAMGVCDFISAMDTDRVPEWNCWYHLLNCGFPLKVSGETDFPCITGSRVGQGRVYVNLGRVDAIDFHAWCQGLAAGRSYVSDGYAHAFDFKVETAAAGEAIERPAGAPTAVTADVAFHRTMPLGSANGGRVAATATRTVELVVNGKVAASKEVLADGQVHPVRFTHAFDRSSWVALRSGPQLHTNPVTVTVGGKPIRASRESARWCVGVIEQLWKVRAKDIAPAERADAEATFRKAIAIYSKIAEE